MPRPGVRGAPAPTPQRPPGRGHHEGRPWVARTARRWPHTPRGTSGRVGREFPELRMLQAPPPLWRGGSGPAPALRGPPARRPVGGAARWRLKEGLSVLFP